MGILLASGHIGLRHLPYHKKPEIKSTVTPSGTFYFNPYAHGTAVFLGPTEARLMDLAWDKGQLTVKRAQYLLKDGKPTAYTTIMTVLGNLARKGLLSRAKQGRSFVYRPSVDKAVFLKERLQTVTDCLQGNFRSLL